MAMLREIGLSGFKSIEAMNLELRSLNVLIGANGAGKSNLVSFFKMLNEMMGERLQQYIATSGRAQSLLRFGPKVTPQIEARLEFDLDDGAFTYHMRLVHAAGDTLAFGDETLDSVRTGSETLETILLGSGHQETRIVPEADTPETQRQKCFGAC